MPHNYEIKNTWFNGLKYDSAFNIDGNASRVLKNGLIMSGDKNDGTWNTLKSTYIIHNSTAF